MQELDILLGLQKHQLVAQTYDGATALSGSRGGVQTRIKKIYTDAHFAHSYAHQLNLILEKMASQKTSVRFFFNSIFGIRRVFLTLFKERLLWRRSLEEIHHHLTRDGISKVALRLLFLS